MPSQAPSTNVSRYFDIGNIVVYYAPAAFTSFSNAISSTTWRKLGMMKDGCQMDGSKEFLDYYSGTPQRLQKRFFTKEDLKVSGQLVEVSPFNMSRVLGGLPLTTAVKSSSPAATTVTTGATKSIVSVASVTGYAVGDLIRVGNSGSYQFGVIKSIGGSAFTLVEDLDGDATPTTGHAVAKVDAMAANLGMVSSPNNVAIKLSKTLAGGFGTLDIYMLCANAEGNFSFNWGDNGSPEAVGLPFSFEGISDPTVESGALAQVLFTQS